MRHNRFIRTLIHINDSIDICYFYKKTEAKIKFIPRTSENLPRRAETWYLGLCSGLNYNYQINIYLKSFGKDYLDRKFSFRLPLGL